MSAVENAPSGSALADDYLASPNNSAYKTLWTSMVQRTADADNATHFVAVGGGTLTTGTVIGATPVQLVYLDPANYAVPGLVTKVRFQAALVTGSAAPGQTVSVSLVGVSAVTGGAITTSGTVVSATSGTLSSTNAITVLTAADTTFSTAGLHYLSLGGTAPSNAFEAIISVQVRNV